MKTIRKTIIISLIFGLLTGCGLLDSTQPQLQGEEKDFSARELVSKDAVILFAIFYSCVFLVVVL